MQKPARSKGEMVAHLLRACFCLYQKLRSCLKTRETSVTPASRWLFRRPSRRRMSDNSILKLLSDLSLNEQDARAGRTSRTAAGTDGVTFFRVFKQLLNL
jgi:hypothetical protein